MTSWSVSIIAALRFDVQGVAVELYQTGYQNIVGLDGNWSTEVGLVAGHYPLLLFELHLQVVDGVRALHIKLQLAII